MKKFIIELKNKVLSEDKITFDEAVRLSQIDNEDIETLDVLFTAANEIRKKFAGERADLCTILNAKSGKCSEDCKYCAQSGHYNTGISEYPLLSYDTILKRAIEMQEKGVHRFSLVTSGRGLEGIDIDQLCNIYKRLSEDTSLKLCASHGIISYEEALKLKESGVSMYHHNIETSSEYFKNICTTHTFKDRIATINNCKRAGLNICSGGIIGLNESLEDRLKMVFELQELKVKSMPVNVLSPIKGTPLEDNEILRPNEILKCIAIFRFILPSAHIRYAGGRSALKDKAYIGFRGGVNSALVGNYLTTIGNEIDEDKQMIIREGLEI